MPSGTPWALSLLQHDLGGLAQEGLVLCFKAFVCVLFLEEVWNFFPSSSNASILLHWH